MIRVCLNTAEFSQLAENFEPCWGTFSHDASHLFLALTCYPPVWLEYSSQIQAVHSSPYHPLHQLYPFAVKRNKHLDINFTSFLFQLQGTKHEQMHQIHFKSSVRKLDDIFRWSVLAGCEEKNWPPQWGGPGGGGYLGNQHGYFLVENRSNGGQQVQKGHWMSSILLGFVHWLILFWLSLETKAASDNTFPLVTQ